MGSKSKRLSKGLAFALTLVILAFDRYSEPGPKELVGLLAFLFFTLVYAFYPSEWITKARGAAKLVRVVSFLSVPLFGVLVFGAWLWPSPPPKSINPVVGWGLIPAETTNGTTFYADLDMKLLKDYKKDFRVVLLWMKYNTFVDPLDDSKAIKSEPFEIREAEQRVSVEAEESFVETLIPSALVRLYVVVVPKTYDVSRMATLKNAIDNGGLILTHKGIQVQANRNMPQALIALAGTKVINNPQLRTSRMEISFENLGKLETVGHINSVILVDGVEAPTKRTRSDPTRTKVLTFVPGQTVTLRFWTTAPPKQFEDILTGSSFVEVRVRIEFDATPERRRVYLYRGSISPPLAELSTLESTYQDVPIKPLK